ncbi:hypothetical protein N7508_002600 [Penicillium antarcticum]|uniref:uncharacterized protein n=1 Tax=Penicillium antarcticum TaxID=416450 RepID=UPI00238E7D35|nr:uncharacterized protein N7508_002600 [Penicillium antarcticum]KAJ5318092.1 hypothetical protein N7508_002600 [Penicillium antarcticum]
MQQNRTIVTRAGNDQSNLEEYAEGPLRLGMLILSKILPRQPSQHSRRVPQPRIRRHGVISPETIANVRILLKEVQKDTPEFAGVKDYESAKEAKDGAPRIHGREDDDAVKEVWNEARIFDIETVECLVDENVLPEAVSNRRATMKGWTQRREETSHAVVLTKITK